MNAEYNKGYQGGYDAGYKRAMLDYGLEDDEPCEDAISLDGVIDTIEWYRTNPHYFTEDNLIEDIKGLPPVTPKQRWIPVSERLPDEHEWIGTKRFGTTISDEVYVTFEDPKGERFTRHLSFQNGKLGISDQQTIDAFFKGSVPIAWMPLPEPYKAESEEST